MRDFFELRNHLIVLFGNFREFFVHFGLLFFQSVLKTGSFFVSFSEIFFLFVERLFLLVKSVFRAGKFRTFFLRFSFEIVSEFQFLFFCL